MEYKIEFLNNDSNIKLDNKEISKISYNYIPLDIDSINNIKQLEIILEINLLSNSSNKVSNLESFKKLNFFINWSNDKKINFKSMKLYFLDEEYIFENLYISEFSQNFTEENPGNYSIKFKQKQKF